MTRRTTLIYALFLLLTTVTTSYARIGDWTTFTNKSDVRDIAFANGTLWCATNGGVFSIRLEDSLYSDYTNIDGLSNIDVRAIEIDSQGRVWAASSDGNLNVFEPETDLWRIVDEYNGHMIYDLEAYGDSIFVALDIGISIYNIVKKEVPMTSRNLGRGFPVEVPVQVIYIHGRDIWLGTEYGIAKSNLDIVNLQAPESWTNYTKAMHGLMTDNIKSITGIDNKIYVGSSEGIDVFDGQQWKVFTTNLRVSSLLAYNNVLYAGSIYGVHRYNEQGGAQLGETFRNVTALTIDNSGTLWAGRLKQPRVSEGYSHYDVEQEKWIHHVPEGPSGNNIRCLAFDQNGALWGGTTKNGINLYENETWKQYNIRELGYADDGITAVVVDQSNNKWFGSYGAGLIKIDSQDSITVFGSEYLSGSSDDPNYIPVTNVVVDSKDNVWCTVYNAGDGNVVAAVSPAGEWQYFSTNDGIITNPDHELYGLAVDQYDRIWVGATIGVTVIDYNGTLMDKSDDDLSGTLTTSDGLISNDVRSIAEDLDGIMWLGTSQGINSWRGENAVYEESGVIHDNIQTITVDVRNNKWFGTVAGISMLAPDNFTWTHYTTTTSPLVYAHVTAFAFDEVTGRAYIGTTNGLSSLETPYAKPEQNLDRVTAGPNPYFPAHGGEFTIYHLADQVSIRIVTPEGKLIRSVSKDDVQGFFAWDGNTDDGEQVGSGIYVYVIFDEETGDSKAGKVAVIR